MADAPGGNLVLVRGRAQVERARAIEPRSRLATADLTAATVLESSGKPFIDLWEYLDEEVLERNWNLSFELSERWWGEGQGVLHRGVSVSAAAAGEWRLVLEAALNARVVFEAALDALSPSSVAVFAEALTPVSRNGPPPLDAPMNSVAVSVLRWILERRGVPFRSLPLPPQAPRATKRRTSKSAAAFVSGVDGLNERPDVQTALLLDFGQNPVDIAELERSFRSRVGWRTARFSEFTRPGYPRWFAPDDASRAALERGWRDLQAQRGSWRGSYPEVFANPHLEFQFARIWQEMSLAIELGDAFDAVVDAVHPSVIVLGVDAFTIERVVIGRARARGIPTAVMVHGGLAAARGWRELVSRADSTLVWGDADVEMLTRFGASAKQLRTVGSLRYMPRWRELAREERRERQSERARLGLPPAAPVVAVLTAATHCGFSTPVARPAAHRRALMGILELAARRTDLTFVLKPHPSYDHLDWYAELTRTAPANFIVRGDVGLTELLPAVDVAMVVNQCTTAALEAALHEVPVMFVSNAIYRLADWQRTSMSEHGALFIDAEQAIEESLDRMLSDAPFRAERLRDARQLLTRSLGPSDARPPDVRIADHLVEIARPPEPDSGIAQRLLEKLRLQGGELAAPEWTELVRALPRDDATKFDAAVFGTVYVLASAARRPLQLRKGTRRLSSALSGAGHSSRVVTRVVLSVFLSAMIQATNQGDWPRVRRLFALLCLEVPRAAGSSALAWRLVAKAVAAENEFAARAANVVERGKGVVARLAAMRRR